MKYFTSLFILASIAFITGCSSAAITTTKKTLPSVYVDVNDSYQKQKEIKITLFRLNNYTDTPRAGLRAANIVEGILLSRGYKIKSRLNEKTPSLKKARKIALEDGSNYFMYGGVSEWRYKTGIDGEPAVSLQLSLYKTKNGKLKWSATGSDNDWGNASIGTTAQNLLETMMTSE